MKYFITILIALFFNNLLISQNCKDKTHHHHELNDQQALKDFKYSQFIIEVSNYMKTYKYDYETDACLRNFYFMAQSALVSEVLKEYIEDRKHDYAAIYQKHLSIFKNQLNVFVENEKQLRVGFEKIKQASLSDNDALKTNGSANPTPQAACTNMDIEAGNLSGWTTNSLNAPYSFPFPAGVNSASAVTPGPDGAVPAINRVFSGSFSACIDVLGSGNGIDWRTIQQTFTVNNSNKNFVFYVAVIVDGGAHTYCTDNPFFNVSVTDHLGATIPCSDVSLVGSTSGGGSCSNYTGWANANGYDYLNWTPVIVPLGAYVGTNVTVKFRVQRCTAYGHGARAYLEASCNPVDITVNGNLICPGKSVGLVAPNTVGYSFNWSGPSGFSSSNYSVTPTLSGAYTVTMSLTSNPSCKMVMDTTLISVPSPTAGFDYTVTPCAPTNSVPVVSTSTAAPGDPLVSYTWVWGDGTPNGTVTPTNHTYSTTGIKTVELIVKSTAGCKDSISKSFTFAPGPVASFTYANGCLGTVSNFSSTSTSTVGIASQVWDFGDGTTGSGANPSHTYTTSGNYSVSLLVTAAVGGCTATVTNTISIYAKPIISFTTSPVCFNTLTNFVNNTTIAAPATISNWAWDYDNDGVVDNATQAGSNTYATAGTFTTVLTATASTGCVNTGSLVVVVNPTPTAVFAPVDACVGANVLLNNTSSVSLPDNISLYNWTFGAGSTPATSSNQNPPLLSYSSSGIKTITLTVTTNHSCTATAINTVNVNPIPVAGFSTTSVCQSIATAFTDMSTTSSGTISNWSWDFTHDGSVDNTTQNPTFVYPSSGSVTAALTVTNSTGCTNSVTAVVNIWGHAIPDFSPNNVCFGTSTTFTNNTNITNNLNVGTTPTYDWDFADGTGVQTLSGNPSHAYNVGGNVNATYNVTLTATTSHSCIDNVVKPVNVYAIPTASFTSDMVCLGSPSHMVDASNGNGNTVNGYAWDFLSNGSVDATGISNPNFTFPAGGSNIVTYTASTTPVAGLVCKNVTTTITVWVNPNPVPDFTFVNKCINAQPNTFDASGSTIAIGTNTAYTWAFGDGATSPSSVVAPTHTYLASGIYNTTLTVTSDQGCQTSIVKQVEVYEKPLMNITSSNACLKNAMTFTAVSLPNSGVVSSWSWDFNNSINSFEGYGQNSSFNFPTSGNQVVHLVAMTGHGCTETFTTQVYVDYLPVPNFSVNKPSGCPLLCVNFTDNTPPVNVPAVNTTWQWFFGDGQTVTANSSASQSHCYDNTSSNQLALFDVKLVVTTDKGCKDSITKNSFITVYPTPIAAYTITPNPGSVVSPVEQFTNQSVDYTKLWWCFGDGPISDTTNINPVHIYKDDNAADYYTYLIVANQYGCKDTAKVKLEIAPDFVFYIPNCFTPGNDDGVNDMFTGKGVGIEKYEMWIFDRWGVSIFYSDDIAKGWNGKVQGKDAPVQQDVYIWKVKLKDVLGKKHDYVGHVTVLR